MIRIVIVIMILLMMMMMMMKMIVINALSALENTLILLNLMLCTWFMIHDSFDDDDDDDDKNESNQSSLGIGEHSDLAQLDTLILTMMMIFIVIMVMT